MNNELVKMLENVLELAKKNELKSLAIVGVYKDNHLYNDISEDCDVGEMIGAMELFKHDLITDTARAQSKIRDISLMV